MGYTNKTEFVYGPANFCDDFKLIKFENVLLLSSSLSVSSSRLLRSPCTSLYVRFGVEASFGPRVTQAWAIPPPSWGLLSQRHRQLTTTPETNDLSSARTQIPVLFLAIAWGDSPRIPIPPAPEKHPKYKKTLKNASNLPPRYVSPRTWSLEITPARYWDTFLRIFTLYMTTNDAISWKICLNYNACLTHSMPTNIPPMPRC